MSAGKLSKAEIASLMAERDALLAKGMRLTKEYTEGVLSREAYEHAVRPGARRMNEIENKLDEIPKSPL